MLAMFEFLKAMILKIDGIRFMTAITVMGTFFMIVNALIFTVIPPANEKVLIHLLGIVEGAVMTIVGYEFGSSKAVKKPEDKTL
jgi:hypothetical protein